jgi:hypothetical protein
METRQPGGNDVYDEHEIPKINVPKPSDETTALTASVAETTRSKDASMETGKPENHDAKRYRKPRAGA